MVRGTKRTTGLGQDSAAVAFGRAVSQLRAKVGISQEELAFRSGSNRTYVSEIERGAKEPCLGTIRKLASSLGLEPSELLRLTEDLLAGR